MTLLPSVPRKSLKKARPVRGQNVAALQRLFKLMEIATFMKQDHHTTVCALQRLFKLMEIATKKHYTLQRLFKLMEIATRAHPRQNARSRAFKGFLS
jgi:hypothetical protein